MSRDFAPKILGLFGRPETVIRAFVFPIVLPTPALDIVTVVAHAIVYADGSAAPITAMTFLLTFQENCESLFRDLPKVGDEADIEVLHISVVEMLKPATGKLLALVTEVHGALRN